MRKAIIAPVVAGLIGFGVLAAPLAAHAGTDPGATTTTFDLGQGLLTLTAANSDAGVSLTADTSATVGDSHVSGELGLVTVTDNKGDNTGWIASATTTPFTAGSGSNISTIPVTSVSYASGEVSGNGGSDSPEFAGTDGASDFAVADPGPSTAVEAASASGGTGSSAATWNPTLTVTLPSYGQLAATYTGTVTQSVA